MLEKYQQAMNALRAEYNGHIQKMREAAAFSHAPDEKKKYEDVMRFFQMKAQHSMYVYFEGMNILKNLEKQALEHPDEPALVEQRWGTATNKEAFTLIQKNQDCLVNSLLLHDLGRVAEFDDKGNPTRLNHVVQSREMLPRYMDDPMTAVAILNHGYPTNDKMLTEQEKDPLFTGLTDEQKKACTLISFVIRDADKLGNWKAFVNQGINRSITARIHPDISREGKEVSVGTYEMSCVEKGVPVDYSQYTNFTGVQVAHMMWATDVALNATKKAAIQGQYVKGLIDYMIEVAEDETALSVVRASTEEQKEAYMSDFRKLILQSQKIFNRFTQIGYIARDDQFKSVACLQHLSDRLLKPYPARPIVQTTGLQRYVQPPVLTVRSFQRELA